MDSAVRRHMAHTIRERSEIIEDPTGKEMSIIRDKHSLPLAQEFCCSVREMYLEALTIDIYPYRYLRNRTIISQKEQITLAESHVSIIGAGGLGGHSISLLARAGIGHLIVVDHDVFDESNLNRQLLSTMNALGRSKSDEAALVVNAINPGVEVTPYHLQLNPQNAREILSGSHVVVDALDNIQDRFVLEATAKELGIPFIHGAVAGFEGQVMAIFPEDVGLTQLYGEGRTDKQKKENPEAILGVPAFTPAIIGIFQAMEVIKIILHRGKPLRNKMRYLDLEAGQVSEFSFTHSNDT